MYIYIYIYISPASLGRIGSHLSRVRMPKFKVGPWIKWREGGMGVMGYGICSDLCMITVALVYIGKRRGFSPEAAARHPQSAAI